ncbi:hypothetical protein BTO30_02080 [Domibacillus antri]|uniref:Uncharacterized protein n=1 Tax=Domibacillus antri TaxID=1714264 RepID=A0A1Q8QA49_9BACI|nr:hypothetical protein BTO30_02080 [Domibacillus antri]
MLIAALFALLFFVRIMIFLENVIADTVIKNILILSCGIPLVFLILFIPYNVWALAGHSYDWDGVYLFGWTFILTVILFFTYYGKRKKSSASWTAPRMLDII